MRVLEVSLENYQERYPIHKDTPELKRLRELMGIPVAAFKIENHWVLATVIEDQTDQDYSYVIARKVKRGGWLCVNMKTSLTLDDACYYAKKEALKEARKPSPPEAKLLWEWE